MMLKTVILIEKTMRTYSKAVILTILKAMKTY